MSLDARVKTPRSGRVNVRRRGRRKLDVVERIWAYHTMTEMMNKASQPADDTSSNIVLATIQQIGCKVDLGLLTT